MKRSFSAMSPRRYAVIALSVIVWAVALLGLLFIFQSEKPPEKKTVFGSVEGRFRSDVSMELEGDTLYYRENEITNFLLIGVDRDNLEAVSGYRNEVQADYIVILSVDRAKRRVTPVMLDRDTMTEIQTYGVFGHPSGKKIMQLCLAQAYGSSNVTGFQNTVSAVEALLPGVRIDHWIALDMSAVPILNDAVGGVQVTLFDDFTAFDPQMKKGASVLLTGEQAQYFVRGRMTVADGTNASRMLRQQTYMKAFLDRVRGELLENDRFITDAISLLGAHVFSGSEESRLYNEISRAADYEWMPVRTPVGEHRTGEDGFAEFHPDEKELINMIAGIWFER